MSDDTMLIDEGIELEEFPWQHPPSTYSIAITGKAFHHLVRQKNQKALVEKVLFKA